MNHSEVLAEIFETVKRRVGADANESYVAHLLTQGLDVVLKKIGEEAAETIVAAKNEDSQELIHELADLWFHTFILLAKNNLEWSQVVDELAKRQGVSGHVEKAQRAQSSAAE